MVDTTQKTKSRRGIGRIVLIVSLAFNLFLLGFLVGGGGPWRPGPAMLGSEMTTLLGASPREFRRFLPSGESRKKLREVLVENQEDIGPAMRESFIARGGILEAITAEPFDKQALTAAFAASRHADDHLRGTTHKATVEFIAELSDEERHAFVEAMRGAVRRGWWRDDDHDHEKPWKRERGERRWLDDDDEHERPLMPPELLFPLELFPEREHH